MWLVIDLIDLNSKPAKKIPEHFFRNPTALWPEIPQHFGQKSHSTLAKKKWPKKRPVKYSIKF